MTNLEYLSQGSALEMASKGPFRADQLDHG
jgi:hypothetical protein